MQRIIPVRKRRNGFSLLELLAVVTILAIIAAVVIPRIGYHTNSSKVESCHYYKSIINSMSERYFFDQGDIPSLDDLQGEPYFQEPIPSCPVSDQSYTLDSKTGRVVGHEH